MSAVAGRPGSVRLIFGWLRRRRRRRLLGTPFPEAWRPYLDALPLYRLLDAGEQARLGDTARVLVAERTWEGAGGLEVTDEMRVTIAALAALLVLEIEHDYFERVTSVLVYPTTYPSVFRHHDRAGVVSEGEPLLGEAWYRGPVLLAWDAVQQGAWNAEDGRNVVLHEFAHRLDMQDGFVDGTPPLGRREAYAAWRRIMTEEYERLVALTRRGRRTVLDAYGATDAAEFFAVVTETFFEKPRTLRRKHPELYGLLRDYYRQDPAARLDRVATGS